VQSFVQTLSRRIAHLAALSTRYRGGVRVDILIDYRAASADQFNSISEMIAVVGV